tara:strand:+ start:63 stop:1157 length:1095 start_codon:yes stop_codon:yes gene_type:complete
MNRVLKRPMFRMGGSTNEGITSGLDMPRQGYSLPGRVDQFDMERVLRETAAQSRDPNILAAYKPYMERPRNEALSRFLINFGLDMASRPPTGKGFSGLLATAAGAAKEPTAQLFKDIDDRRLTKQAAEADLFKTLLQGNIDIAAEAAGADNSAATKSYAKLEIANDIEKTISEIADLEARKEKGEDVQLQLDQKKSRISYLTKENKTGEALMKQTDFAENVLKSIVNTLKDQTNADGSLKYPDGRKDTRLLEEAYRQFYRFFQTVPDEREADADGGRAGYMTGGGADMGTAPATTDQEPRTTDKMPIDYDTLRARLPKEITDDIVRLIAASPEALEDFATISTQQDVDLFNQRYSVNLVLPQEA